MEHPPGGGDFSPVSRKRLSNAEIERILDVESPIRTGFTYARSQAYNKHLSERYVHPRMCRPMSRNSSGISYSFEEGSAKREYAVTRSLFRSEGAERRTGVFRSTVYSVWTVIIRILTSPFYAVQTVLATGASCLSAVVRRCETFVRQLYYLMYHVVNRSLFRRESTERHVAVTQSSFYTLRNAFITVVTSPFYVAQTIVTTGVSYVSALVRRCATFLSGLYHLVSYIVTKPFQSAGTRSFNCWLIALIILLSALCLPFFFLPQIENFKDDKLMSQVSSKDRNAGLLTETEKVNEDKVLSLVAKKLAEQKGAFLNEIERVNEEKVLSMVASKLTEQNAGLLAEIQKVNEDKMLSLVASKLAEQKAAFLSEIEKINEEKVISMLASKLTEQNAAFRSEIEKINEERVLSMVASMLAEQKSTFLNEIEKMNEDKVLTMVSSKLTEQNAGLLSELERVNEEKVLSMVTSKLTEQNAALRSEIEKISEDRVLSMVSSMLSEQKATFVKEIERMNEDKVLSMVAAKLAEQNAGLFAEIEKIKEERHTVTDSCTGRQFALNEIDIDRIQKMIKRSIDVYDADKTGKADYALESAGGSVIGTRCTEPYREKSRLESIYGIPLWYSSYSPRSVIQRKAQGATAGECWAFIGGRGYLTIRLAGRVDVSSVSYEHLPASVSPQGHIKSAPKEFIVWSYQDPDDMSSRVLLGSYEFDSNGSAIQTFDVQNIDPQFTPFIELEVVSNHGSDYTCLYRFRVHGKLVEQQF